MERQILNKHVLSGRKQQNLKKSSYGIQHKKMCVNKIVGISTLV